MQDSYFEIEPYHATVVCLGPVVGCQIYKVTYKKLFILYKFAKSSQMAGRDMSREEALSRLDHKHACHILLYADSNAKLFGKIPIKHIVLVSKFLCLMWNIPENSVRSVNSTRHRIYFSN